MYLDLTAITVVSSIRGRLAALRKKLALMAKRTPTPVAGKMPPMSNVAVASPTVGATPPK